MDTEGGVDRGRWWRGPWPRDRLLALVVPAILVAVAGMQVVVASSTDLTAWRTGGFGMFSTIDAHSTRFLRVDVTTDDGRTLPVDLADLTEQTAFQDAFVEHRAWPRDGTADGVATALGGLPLVEDDGVLFLDPDPEGDGDGAAMPPDVPPTGSMVVDGVPVAVDEVVVEVWTWTLERDGGEFTPHRLDAREVGP